MAKSYEELWDEAMRMTAALDWPKVVVVAKQNASRMNVGDRYATIAGDARFSRSAKQQLRRYKSGGPMSGSDLVRPQRRRSKGAIQFARPLAVCALVGLSVPTSLTRAADVTVTGAAGAAGQNG